MRSHLSSLIGLTLAWATLQGTLAFGQEYKIEVLKERPPSSVSPKILATIREEGYRILGVSRKPFADLWLRKSIPASGAPKGPKGAIQFPFLAEGEILGVLKFEIEGRDYRDQSIPTGVYILRYGLQPINGAHRGVSVFRDFALLLPASKDSELANLAGKPLHEASVESAGASHPTCLLMSTPASPPALIPSLVHDEQQATWGANLPLNLGVKDSKEEISQTIQLIVVGASMAG